MCGRTWHSAELPLSFVEELMVARKKLKSHQKEVDEEASKQKTELEALKAKVVECVRLNKDLDRALGAIQSMPILPLSLEEMFARVDAANAELKALGLGETVPSTENTDCG
jgi:hypothetical protein